LVREHGFAHHSDTRGANLAICYEVIVYKLAEQIIKTHKRIHLPSYYGIFKESDIEFSDVRLDSNFEREDKQPDVIATTIDGKQFLIEFYFEHKNFRKQAIDFKNLTCLEVDLSQQTLESLENFLLNTSEDRRWFNNQLFFDRIIPAYESANKQIRIVEDAECDNCMIKYTCCAVKSKESNLPIEIDNSGHTYRICKTEEYERAVSYKKSYIAEQERIRKEQEEERTKRRERIQAEQERIRKEQEEERTKRQERLRLDRIEKERLQRTVTESIATEDRTCFMCQRNLDWMGRGSDVAHCGAYISMGVPRNTPPDTAKYCKGFIAKMK